MSKPKTEYFDLVYPDPELLSYWRLFKVLKQENNNPGDDLSERDIKRRSGDFVNGL